jgi:CheY-like chemotaxis protein/DNA-binding transcriptional ArsR family regulator
MNKHALVVEDNPDIVETAIQDAFVTLDHHFDVAGSLEEARTAFRQGKYDYVLLDLSIPARPGGSGPLKENGLRFLEEIRRTYNAEQLPVCAITSFTKDGFNCSLELARLSVNACAAKPFDDQPLNQVIAEMLRLAGKKRSDTLAGRTKPVTLQAFRAETRTVVVYTDAITVCGEVVWSESGRGDDIRKILLALNQRDEDGNYIPVKGGPLEKMLNRNASNKVGRPIGTFRDAATERLAIERGLECGKQDIIATRPNKGYCLQPWIEVTQENASYQGPGLHIASIEAEANLADENGADLTDRQKEILACIRQGDRPDMAALRKLTGKSRAVVNRDLKVLRDAGLIESAEDGGYVVASD